MIFSFIIFITFWIFSKCSTKNICLATDGSKFDECESYYTRNNLLSTANFTKILEDYVKTISERNITIWLKGSFLLDVRLKIFNNRIVNFIDLYMVRGSFTLHDIRNITLTISMIEVTFNGIFNDNQTSLNISSPEIKSSNKVAYLKSLTSRITNIPFTQVYTDLLIFHKVYAGNITLNDNNIIIISDHLVEFPSNNLNIIIESCENLNLTNNMTENTFISNVLINNTKIIRLQGNEFINIIPLIIHNCISLITGIKYLSPLSFTFSENVNYNLILQKSVIISGGMHLPFGSNISIDTSENDLTTRVSADIDSISLNNGTINFESSWIDLIVYSFTFNTVQIPIIPCVGSGGISTIIANNILYAGNDSLVFDTLIVQFDVSGILSDKKLSILMSQEWNLLSFKSFSEKVPSSNSISKIKFLKDIYGFGGEYNIFNVKSEITDDFTIIANVSSYYTIPLLLEIFYETKISELIPPETKKVNLTLNQCTKIDLTGLQTHNLIITFNNRSTLDELKMDDYNENYPSVHHIIFDNTYFRDGNYIMNAKKLTFTDEIVIGRSDKIKLNIPPNCEIHANFYHMRDIIPLVNGDIPYAHIYREGSRLLDIQKDYYYFGTYDLISHAKLPNVVFHMDMSTYKKEDKLVFNLKTSNSDINNVSLIFESDYYDQNITVSLVQLSEVKTAGKIEVDFGNFTKYNVIDYNSNPKRPFLSFKGTISDIINVNVTNGSKFCACSGLSCDYCEENTNKVSYEELDEKIKTFSEYNQVYIYVVGNEDGKSPRLSFDSIENKDATIFGIGNNPKIRIDCSKNLYDHANTVIKFRNITVVHDSGDKFEVSNLEFDENCIIDQSFKDIPLISNIINCSVTHLDFKSIFAYNCFTINGDLSSVNFEAYVSFAKSCRFYCNLPSLATFQGANLVIGKLKFNLANSIPYFICADCTLTGDHGCLDDLYTNATINLLNCKTLRFNGTWGKVRIPNYFSIDAIIEGLTLFLDSENIPLGFKDMYDFKVFLGSQKVSIFGELASYSGTNFTIDTSIKDRVSFHVEQINILYNSNYLDIILKSSNIDLIIDTFVHFYSLKTINTYFNILVDLDGYNTIRINNPCLDATSDPICFTIHMNFYGFPDDQRIYNYFGQNITFFEGNTSYYYSHIYLHSFKYNTNLKTAFHSGVFFCDFQDDKGSIYSNVLDPFEEGITLTVGDNGANYNYIELPKSHFNMFERYVPKHNSNVTIIFYEDMDYDSFIDLDKEKLTIPSLTLDAPSYIAYKCSFKFGNSVGDLNVKTVKLNFIESEYHMQKGTFEILSSISGHYDLCNFTSLYLDYELFLSGNIKEYQNDIEINSDSSNYQIKFTSLGIDVIDDKSNKILFQIDVEKFPKCTVNFKYNPIFEIEDGLVETKPIYLMRFRFIKYFTLPASWEKVTFTNHVNFEVIDSFNLYIISSTYNFDCWDIMNKYPIQLDQKMSSFDIFGTKTLYNNNITMKMFYSDAYRNYFYDIDIVTLDMTGNSSFNTLKDYVYADQGNVLIFNLRVLNGVSNIGVVEVRTIQVYPGSRLNCLYNLSAFSNISYISLYWDLDQPPVLFSRLIQNLNDCPIYIQYKGSSIRKRKKLFDNFLTNGTLIMTNIANVTKERIHFVSNNITEFNDGDDLALEIRYINNDIYMFSTRQLYNESEVFETDTPSQSPSESNLPSPTPSDTATASFSPEQTNPPTEELISSSLIEISRTQKPSFTEPIIENYQSNNETIIFESNGYRDGDDFVPVKNDGEIALINSNQQNLFLKINENGQTNNALFLSPQNEETTITIVKLPEGRNVCVKVVEIIDIILINQKKKLNGKTCFFFIFNVFYKN